MYTSGDISHEGPEGKRFFLTSVAPPAPYVIALGAGDSSDELQICRLAARKIKDGAVDSVAGAAECFAEAYREYRLTVFERELFSPLGLTFDDFTNRQHELSPPLVSRIDRLLRDRYLPISNREFGCSTIIAGVDTVSGLVPDYITAHLYMVRDPGQVTCDDTLGFAAVGSGARQAETYLMLDGYTPDRIFDHAALSVYSAKRAAEKAPFVGPETELLRLDNSGIGTAKVDDLKGIEKIYQKKLRRIKTIDEGARTQMAAFMEGLNAKATQALIEAQAPPANSDGTANEEDVRSESEEGESPN
jgi:hypothetical protein